MNRGATTKCHFKRLLLWTVAAVAGLAARAGGLPVAFPGADEDVTVSMLTAYPGNIIYELEGHTMLRIRYGGYDMCVNWGVFDFNESDFVYRFVKGETDYMAACYPTRLALHEYEARGRRVTEQVLALDSVQARRVVELVDRNLQPENVRYRYNYVLDNCATRPLAVVEGALGDSLRFAGGGESGAQTTFREMMRGYHRNYPWYQFGIDIALGSGIDRPITIRQSAFAPVRLKAMLDGAETAAGTPVVRAERVLADGSERGIVSPPTPWWCTPDAVCWTLAVIGAASLAITLRRHHRPRILTTVVFSANFLTGMLLTFLIFVSTHEATSPNWLYLWLNPLCVVPVISVWLKKCNKVLIFYHFANFAALFCLGIVAVTGIQSMNRAFVPLVMLDALISATTLISVKWSKSNPT